MTFRQSVIASIPLCILLVLASLNFFLLLRHKSPYVTDSYFYTHMMYEFQGNSFDDAYRRVVGKIDITQFDAIGQNFFLNQDRYAYSLSRYIRRPLYPLTAYLINSVVHNEYIALLLPNFISYIGCFVLLYLLFQLRFGSFWATLGTALFMGFYPFLDWSTYFLTDTIGAFFWLLQIYLLFRYVNQPNNATFGMYIVLLLVSLLNRELGVLLFLVILPMIVNARTFTLDTKIVSRLKKLFVASGTVSLVYIVGNTFLKQPSLYDSWIYLQSSFGYYAQSYTLTETMVFLVEALVRLHLGLMMELVRYRWWGLFTILGLIGVIQVFLVYKKPKFIDVLMLFSSAVAYIGLIIVPFLSYRYFYPTIIGVIYFALHAIRLLFAWQQQELGVARGKIKVTL